MLMVVLYLDNPAKKVRIEMSSNFHGFIMESLENRYADALHQSLQQQPFSQHLEITDEYIKWVISVVNPEWENIIGSIFEDSNLTQIWIKNHDMHLNIIKREIIRLSIDELMKNTYFTQCSRYVTIEFLTPTAFKQQGKYVIYPQPELIFNSLLQKYNFNQDDTMLSDEKLLEHLSEAAQVKRYKLKTVPFQLEGIKINGFVGEISYRLHGPQMLVNLAQMLLKYGEFSGIGIKAALGMGAIHIR